MIRSRFFFAACALGAAAVGASCAAPVSNPASFSFNRPTSVDFVCLRVPVGSDGRISNDTLTMGAEVEAFPLSDCPTVNAASNSDVQMVGGGYVGLRLFALVTQADRGEVAVVNLHPRFNTGNFDTQPRVPGFTFIPSGLFASALSVHPAGRVSYVANAGERSITILDNRRLLAGHAFRLSQNGAAVAITDLPAEPIDLAIRTVGAAPARYALYVLLRNGAVRVYDVSDPLVAPVLSSEVQLRNPSSSDADAGASDASADSAADAAGDSAPDSGPDAAPDAVDAAAEASPDVLDDASDASSDDVTDASMDASDAARDAGNDSAADGVGPDANVDASVDATSANMDASADASTTLPGVVIPTKFAVADDGRVFVSDRGLPIVHVLEPSTDGFVLTEGRPLQAGTGTVELAVSPRLPSDQTHWVYAVTINDRQLLAIDATRTNGAPSATYGTLVRANSIADHPGCRALPFDPNACPKIDPNLPHDRVPVRAPTRSVRFVAVSGRNESGLASCDVSQPFVEQCTSSPTPRLDVFRGVQAVVALANGQIQLVDLEDPDRNCDVRVGSSVRRAFLRHIPRGGDATSKPSLIGAPQLTINGGSSSFGGPNPRLARIDGTDGACDSNNNHCVVLPLQPQDQTQIDPVAVRDATYTLRYEGQLPLRAINAASFVSTSTDGVIRMQAPGARLCQLGAVSGDRVVLAGPSPYTDMNLRADASVPIAPTDPACVPDECRRVFGDSNVLCNREFAVTRATQDGLDLEIPRTMLNGQLVAGAPCGTINAPGGFAASSAEFARLLSCCYPQAARVEVRASQRWVLSTLPAGRSVEFAHNVVERDGACVQDPSLGPSGRVRENEVYDAGWFQLRIASGSQPTLRDTSISFATGGGYAQLVSNNGASGASVIRHVCNSDRVYIVDQTPATLREYSLAPFIQTRTFN
ncbi:MAG: hypothetical protein U0269_00850 [Polyangiales bacterium]